LASPMKRQSTFSWALLDNGMCASRLKDARNDSGASCADRGGSRRESGMVMAMRGPRHGLRLTECSEKYETTTLFSLRTAVDYNSSARETTAGAADSRILHAAAAGLYL